MRKRPLNRKEVERGEGDVLECDAAASCLYVNEPKQKVDLTKYVERHTFRCERDLRGVGGERERGVSQYKPHCVCHQKGLVAVPSSSPNLI